jgi:hypothetical protein
MLIYIKCIHVPVQSLGRTQETHLYGLETDNMQDHVNDTSGNRPDSVGLATNYITSCHIDQWMGGVLTDNGPVQE